MAQRLLSPDGRPVRMDKLEEPIATATLTGVRQPWATSIATGMTPVRLAQVLSDADQGQITEYMQLAQEMEERDPHYAAVLGVRKRAVSGVRPMVEAASEDKRDVEIAHAVEQHIVESDLFTSFVEDLLDALGKGLSAVEIGWKREAKHWSLGSLEWVDPRFLRVDRDTARTLLLMDEANVLEGIALEPYRFVVHEPMLKSGLSIRGGLARLVAFIWLLKKYDEKDWMACIELFGMPLRLGKYSSGSTPSDRDALRRAVSSIGTDAAAMIPEDMQIEFIEAMKGTGEPPYEKFARYADEQVSKAVLGQTMTSDNGSSQSQAEVHDSVRHDIAAADARAVSATINRDLVRPYVDFNFGPQARYPRILINVAEREDTDMILRNAARLIAVGVSFKASELRSKLGLSDPEKGDEIVGGPAPKPKDAVDPMAANRRALNREDATSPWPLLDELEGELLDGWRDVMEDLIAPIEDQLAQATSVEQALNMIAKLDMPGAPAALVEQLAISFVKARGIGDALNG